MTHSDPNGSTLQPDPAQHVGSDHAGHAATDEAYADGRDNPSRKPRSLGALISDLTRHVTELFRNEIRLAKTELKEKVDQALTGMVYLATGFLLGLAALLVMLDAIVIALANFMPHSLAAALVGITVTVVAVLFVRAGAKDLDPENLKPEKAFAALRRDKAVIKEHLS